mmetsp:Transcript_44276/g.58753  ORF Transcript_44276/g.58753 Transcript_44276/m.58753 type:complete len:315 (+) Transcript_44276:943-1887(+)
MLAAALEQIVFILIAVQVCFGGCRSSLSRLVLLGFQLLRHLLKIAHLHRRLWMSVQGHIIALFCEQGLHGVDLLGLIRWHSLGACLLVSHHQAHSRLRLNLSGALFDYCLLVSHQVVQLFLALGQIRVPSALALPDTGGAQRRLPLGLHRVGRVLHVQMMLVCGGQAGIGILPASCRLLFVVILWLPDRLTHWHMRLCFAISRSLHLCVALRLMLLRHIALCLLLCLSGVAHALSIRSFVQVEIPIDACLLLSVAALFLAVASILVVAVHVGEHGLLLLSHFVLFAAEAAMMLLLLLVQSVVLFTLVSITLRRI